MTPTDRASERGEGRGRRPYCGIRESGDGVSDGCLWDLDSLLDLVCADCGDQRDAAHHRPGSKMASLIAQGESRGVISRISAGMAVECAGCGGARSQCYGMPRAAVGILSPPCMHWNLILGHDSGRYVPDPRRLPTYLPFVFSLLATNLRFVSIYEKETPRLEQAADIIAGSSWRRYLQAPLRQSQCILPASSYDLLLLNLVEQP